MAWASSICTSEGKLYFDIGIGDNWSRKKLYEGANSLTGRQGIEASVKRVFPCRRAGRLLMMSR